MSESYEVIANIQRRRILDQLRQDKRIDGRGLLDYRPIQVNPGVIGKASGSAWVSIGKTQVLVGVKVETGTPYPDKPDAGVLTVNAELVPIASPSFEPGPPNEDSVELARVVDRGLRESQAVDLSKLCVTPGKLVFIVFVDIYILDHDGNLFDAAALAAIAALMNTTLRGYTVTDEGTIEYTDATSPLPLQNIPVEVTMVKIGDKLLLDPTIEEEALIDTQITIATGQNQEVCAIQKSQVGTFTLDEVHQAMEIATNKADEIRTNVLEAIDNGAT
jgi:exosome complex component RRP42